MSNFRLPILAEFRPTEKSIKSASNASSLCLRAGFRSSRFVMPSAVRAAPACVLKIALDHMHAYRDFEDDETLVSQCRTSARNRMEGEDCSHIHIQGAGARSSASCQAQLERGSAV